jgi:hypothetical protein
MPSESYPLGQVGFDRTGARIEVPQAYQTADLMARKMRCALICPT